jgi:CHAT domain-containing protein/tetratricopeptide (TPR) repeat protein
LTQAIAGRTGHGGALSGAWGRMGSRNWLVGAAILIASPLTIGAAQDSQTIAFDPDANAYAGVRALAAKAEALVDAEDAPLDRQAAAWTALHDAAIKVRVGPQRLPHPLAGYALTAIAVDLQSEGDLAGALPKAQRGLEMLRPFREQYPELYRQSVSTLGFILSTMGKPSEAIVPLAEGADWSQAYFAKLPTDRKSKDAHMAKSNLEYAYAQALSALGQADRAVEYQRRSMETRRASLGPNDPDSIAAQGWYAIMLLRAGQREEAEQAARMAAQAAVDHLDPAHTGYARALEVLGIVLARSGRRAESIDYFLRSAELKRKHGGTGNSNFYFALLNLSDSLIQLERYDEAASLALEAAKGWQGIEGDNNEHSAQALSLAGLAAAGSGDTDGTIRQLGGALAMTLGLDANAHDVDLKALPALIAAQLDAGHADEARRLAEMLFAAARTATPFAAAYAELLRAYASDAPTATTARRLIEVMRGDRLLATSGELAQEHRTALELVLRSAVRSGDGALALDAMTILSGSKIAQANRLVTERLTATDPALAARIRAEQDAAKTFHDADTVLLKALAGGSGVAEARVRRDAAAAALDGIRTDLARDFPRWAETSAAAAPDLAAIQAGLSRTEAVLVITPAFDGVYTLAVTHDAATVRRTPLGRSAIVALVARLRASLPAGTYDADAAHTLYAQFFPAADAAMLRGITSLRIAPSGPIASLPFAALIEKRVSRIDRATPWLIRRFALEIAPSISAGPAPQLAAASQGRFLGIGAPTPFGTPGPSAQGRAAASYYRGGLADAGALADLPVLPGSAAELDAVARAFGPAQARLLTGDQASEAGLRAMDLKPYSTILFATHGLVSGEMEGVTEPALVLARPRPGDGGDGLLTASEIATLRLDADWVILSACNTAAGDRVDAAAYSGLAQAFRYAGARALLLSHWPVRDDAASFVTVETIANARKGMRRDVALQQAMLKLMRTRLPDAASPYIWAPYILVGGALGGGS